MESSGGREREGKIRAERTGVKEEIKEGKKSCEREVNECKGELCKERRGEILESLGGRRKEGKDQDIKE